MATTGLLTVCRTSLDELVVLLSSAPPVDSLSGEEAARLAEALATGEHACAAARQICARRVVATGQFTAEGYTDAAGWLAAVSGESYGRARGDLETAKALESAPATQAAFAAGEISSLQASEVARGVKEVPSAEEQLLRTAREGTLAELRDEAAKVRAAARSTEADDKRRARVRSRRFLSTWAGDEGSVEGRFSLAAEDGAIVIGRLGKIARRIFDENRREGVRDPERAAMADALVALCGGEEVAFAGAGDSGAGDSGAGDSGAGDSGAGDSGAGDSRVVSTDGARGTEGGAAAGRPCRITKDGPTGVTHPRSGGPGGPSDPVPSEPGGCSDATASSPGRAEDRASRGPGTWSDPAPMADPISVGDVGTVPGSGAGRPPRRLRPDYTIVMRVDLEALQRGFLAPGEECSIDGVGPVPVSLVASYLEQAKVRLVIERFTKIDSIVTFTRTIPTDLRTALEHRDRACVVPSCSSSFHLEIDHIIEVENNGPTCLDNLCRLCHYHHRQKSELGYRIERESRSWKWYSPAGKLICG